MSAATNKAINYAAATEVKVSSKEDSAKCSSLSPLASRAEGLNNTTTAAGRGMSLHIAVADLLRRHLLPRVCSFFGGSMMPANPGPHGLEHDSVDKVVTGARRTRHNPSKSLQHSADSQLCSLEPESIYSCLDKQPAREMFSAISKPPPPAEVAYSESDSGSDGEWSVLNESEDGSNSGYLIHEDADTGNQINFPFANFVSH